eukprot:15554-Heterococcus_DN1.PRE.2
MHAAPKPLSMFTTLTPGAQAFSIVSRGATPPVQRAQHGSHSHKEHRIVRQAAQLKQALAPTSWTLKQCCIVHILALCTEL